LIEKWVFAIAAIVLQLLNWAAEAARTEKRLRERLKTRSKPASSRAWPTARTRLMSVFR